jgi:hypothetical protein
MNATFAEIPVPKAPQWSGAELRDGKAPAGLYKNTNPSYQCHRLFVPVKGIPAVYVEFGKVAAPDWESWGQDTYEAVRYESITFTP